VSDPATVTTFEHGDFVRLRGNGACTHIVDHVWDGKIGVDFMQMACGKLWPSSFLRPADGDSGRQCQACWEAM
jgi:hypothetical protein